MHEFSLTVDLFENPATDARSLESPATSKDAPAASSAWQMSLARIIESEIIPRLMLSNVIEARTRIPPATVPSDLSDFIKLLLDPDSRGELAYIRQLETHGLPLEVIFLEVLGRASRYLGALWESDHCDFLEVTDGLHRLHHILQILSPGADENPVNGRRAMFLAAPCETHDFGVTIVEKFFRNSGWWTKRCLEQDHLAALREVHYDVVGFSLSCDGYIDGLNAAVKKAQQVSKNSAIKVLVGGTTFQRNPKLIEVVEADGMAVDAPSAVAVAENLLSEGAFV
jgi:methanogenic corrinoid protein MtbC1